MSLREIEVLVSTGELALVTAVVTDAWTVVRHRMTKLLRRRKGELGPGTGTTDASAPIRNQRVQNISADGNALTFVVNDGNQYNYVMDAPPARPTAEETRTEEGK